LAKKLETSFSQDRFAYTARARYKGKQIIMILPTTFMNLSGKAVRYWLDSENIEIENMIVITDDIDLPVGTIRIKSKGSGGSHNGLNHIIETLGHQNFPRLRFGIGKDYPKGFQVDYVLGRFSKEELEAVNPRIER
jgi:PTH1 family peptidyl-tRNA hydrolase